MFANTKELAYCVSSGSNHGGTAVYDSGYGYWVKPTMINEIDGLVLKGKAVAKRWPSQFGGNIWAKLTDECTTAELAETMSKDGPALTYNLYEIAPGPGRFVQDGARFYYLQFTPGSAPFKRILNPSGKWSELNPTDLIVVPQHNIHTDVPLKPGSAWHHYGLDQISDLKDVFDVIRWSTDSMSLVLSPQQ